MFSLASRRQAKRATGTSWPDQVALARQLSGLAGTAVFASVKSEEKYIYITFPSHFYTLNRHFKSLMTELLDVMTFATNH